MFARPRLIACGRRGLPWLLALVLGGLIVAPGAYAGSARVDRAFGQGGIATPWLAPHYGVNWLSVAAEEPSGSILATLVPGVNHGPEVLYRYLPDGSIDPSFAPQAPPPNLTSSYRAGTALPDGTRLLSPYGGWNNGYLERVDEQGQPVTGYGDQGRSASVPFTIRSVRPLPSGQVMVAGQRIFDEGKFVPTREEAAVARIEPDGDLDTSFGSGGVVGLRASMGIDDHDVAGLGSRQDGGTTVVINAPRGRPAVVVGLTASGDLDASYGEGGQARVAMSVRGVQPAPGGELSLAGQVSGQKRCCADFAAARLTTDGVLDPVFGESGLARIDLGGDDQLSTVRWQDDGAILLAGSTTRISPNCAYFNNCWEIPAIVRLAPTGRLDSGFGEGGGLPPARLATPTSGSEQAGVTSIEPRSAGGFFLAGRAGMNAFIAAISADGALDRDFAGDGLITRRAKAIPRVAVADMATDSRGRIFVAGSTDADSVRSSSPVVIRYRRNGSIERGWGSGGFAYAGWNAGRDASAIAVDRRGRVVVVGGSNVLRLTSSGRPDRSFGKGGVKRLASSLQLRSVAVLRDGRVLLTGVTDSRRGRTVVVRLRTDGSLDRRFHGGGIDLVGCGRRRACTASQMTVDRRGRILLAGVMRRRRRGEWTPALALGRLLPNGRLDRRFGRGGWVARAIGPRSLAADVTVQGKRILVAGTSAREQLRVADLLLRFRPNGRLDRSFAHQGVARTAVKPLHEERNLVERMSVLSTRRGIVVVRSGESFPLLAFGRDGRRIRIRGSRARVAPRRLLATYLPPSPVGALQGDRVVFAWNQSTPSGRGGVTTRVALQRLLVP